MQLTRLVTSMVQHIMLNMEPNWLLHALLNASGSTYRLELVDTVILARARSQRYNVCPCEAMQAVADCVCSNHNQLQSWFWSERKHLAEMTHKANHKQRHLMRTVQNVTLVVSRISSLKSHHCREQLLICFSWKSACHVGALLASVQWLGLMQKCSANQQAPKAASYW